MKYLNEILGIRYPFIQGGMANIATGEFAAACSNAGGLGLIGSGGMDAAGLEEEIHTARQNTERPFGVNLMLMNPDADAMADLIARERIRVVTTGAGNPGRYIDRWKENGIIVIPVAAGVLPAKRMIRAGADAIIAEGTESGGHIGEMTTLTLVPQMADAVDVPVIAAGGIADGRGLAAAYCLGACGVQLGTVLLASEECPVHPAYKQAVLDAADNSTAVTGRSVQAPVRVIKNAMTRQYLKKEAAGADRMELEKFTLGSLRRAVFEGDTKAGSLMAGQVCGQVHAIRPVSRIFEDLEREAETIIHEMAEFSVQRILAEH